MEQWCILPVLECGTDFQQNCRIRERVPLLVWATYPANLLLLLKTKMSCGRLSSEVLPNEGGSYMRRPEGGLWMIRSGSALGC